MERAVQAEDNLDLESVAGRAAADGDGTMGGEFEGTLAT